MNIKITGTEFSDTKCSKFCLTLFLTVFFAVHNSRGTVLIVYNLKLRLYNKPVERETDIMINKWQITIPELSGEEKRNVFFDSDATYGKCWGMK